jgi:hypothetical protein
LRIIGRLAIRFSQPGINELQPRDVNELLFAKLSSCHLKPRKWHEDFIGGWAFVENVIYILYIQMPACLILPSAASPIRDTRQTVSRAFVGNFICKFQPALHAPECFPITLQMLLE